MNLVKLEDDNELIIEDAIIYEDEPKEEGLSVCAKVGLTILGLATIGYGACKAYNWLSNSDKKIEDSI